MQAAGAGAAKPQADTSGNLRPPLEPGLEYCALQAGDIQASEAYVKREHVARAAGGCVGAASAQWRCQALADCVAALFRLRRRPSAALPRRDEPLTQQRTTRRRRLLGAARPPCLRPQHQAGAPEA